MSSNGPYRNDQSLPSPSLSSSSESSSFREMLAQFTLAINARREKLLENSRNRTRRAGDESNPVHQDIDPQAELSNGPSTQRSQRVSEQDMDPQSAEGWLGHSVNVAERDNLESEEEDCEQKLAVHHEELLKQDECSRERTLLLESLTTAHREILKQQRITEALKKESERLEAWACNLQRANYRDSPLYIQVLFDDAQRKLRDDLKCDSWSELKNCASTLLSKPLLDNVGYLDVDRRARGGAYENAGAMSKEEIKEALDHDLLLDEDIKERFEAIYAFTHETGAS